MRCFAFIVNIWRLGDNFYPCLRLGSNLKNIAFFNKWQEQLQETVGFTATATATRDICTILFPGGLHPRHRIATDSQNISYLPVGRQVSICESVAIFAV